MIEEPYVVVVDGVAVLCAVFAHEISGTEGPEPFRMQVTQVWVPTVTG